MRRFMAAALATIALVPGARAEDVRFRLTARRAVIVPVMVNGQGPYDFLLDTGSTTSLVDLKLAEELELRALGTTVSRTATGTQRVTIARVDRIDLGPRSARTVVVLCARLKGIRSIDRAIRGVLGFNFLSRFQYLLDYTEKRLTFGENVPETGIHVPFDSSHRAIVIRVNELRLLLDTGATGVVLFKSDGAPVEVSPRALHTVTTNEGRSIVTSGWIHRFDIGEQSFHHVPVTLVPQTELEEIADGLLPGTFFESIYFDHERRQVILNPRGPNEQRAVVGSIPCSRVTY